MDVPTGRGTEPLAATTVATAQRWPATAGGQACSEGIRSNMAALLFLCGGGVHILVPIGGRGQHRRGGVPSLRLSDLHRGSGCGGPKAQRGPCQAPSSRLIGPRAKYTRKPALTTHMSGWIFFAFPDAAPMMAQEMKPTPMPLAIE